MSEKQVAEIQIKGARTNNLKDIDIRIPHHQFVVVTGVSGSGKSSLIFDVIAKEGQRRYVETLPSFSRQFVGKLSQPDVDSISGLSPVIAIGQKTVGGHARSTVGTVSDVYDLLRLLFARKGESEGAANFDLAQGNNLARQNHRTWCERRHYERRSQSAICRDSGSGGRISTNGMGRKASPSC